MLVDVKPTPRLVPAPTSAIPRPRQRITLAVLAFLLGATVCLVLSGLAIARHEAFASGQHDLEIYAQTLWNTAQGRPFATTLLKTNELHLAEHLALVLLPLAPLYGLVPEPRLLLGLQQLALALAGLPVWLVARRRLGAGAALLLLAGFYLMPSLAGVALDDFHPVALTAAPLAGAALLLLEHRWRSGLCLASSVVLLEEEAALVVAGLGLWLLLERRWRPGGGLLALGAAMLLAATLLVMPGFHHPATLGLAGGNRSLSHFGELRNDPAVGIRRLVGDRGPDAALSFLLPTGGTALLAPPLLAASLPTGAALFLQDRADTFHRHWAAPILPLIWLAAAVGLGRLGTQIDGPGVSTAPHPSSFILHPSPVRVGLALVAVGTVAAYLLASPLPGGAAFDPAILAGGPHEIDLASAVRSVPPEARLAVSANVAAHLANREEVYVYPIDDHYLSGLRFEDREIEAYALDLEEPNTQRVPPLKRGSPLLADPPYVVWSSGHKVMLLLRERPTPSHPSGATFNRRLMLVGYDFERSGDRLQLRLQWEKTRGAFADFDRLAELVDGSGNVVSSDSNLPLTSLFTVEKWKVGQVVIDHLDLRLGGAGPYTLRLAWLNRDRQTPLALDGGGQALEIPLDLR